MTNAIDSTDLERVFSRLRTHPNDEAAQQELGRVLSPQLAIAAERYTVTKRGAEAFAQDLRRLAVAQRAQLVERWFADRKRRYPSQWTDNDAISLLAKPRPRKWRAISADDLKLDVLHEAPLKLRAILYEELCAFIRRYFTRDSHRELAERMAHPLVFGPCLRPSFRNNASRAVGASRLVVCCTYSIVAMELRQLVANRMDEFIGSTK